MTPKMLLGAVMLSAVLAPFGGNAHRKTEEGNRDYESGEYESALRHYTDAQVDLPEAPELFYDIGNVLYRQGDVEGAAESYTRALLTAPEGLVPYAAYNLGNARFAQQDYEGAIKAYQRALRADPGDQQAKRNLELALRALEQQPKQQKPSEDQDQEDPQDQQEQGQQPQPDPNEEQKQNPGQEDEPQPSSAEEGQQEQQQQQQDPGQAAEAESAPQRMTEEQARRLLDSLKDQEREELRRMRTAGDGTVRERDW